MSASRIKQVPTVLNHNLIEAVKRHPEIYRQQQFENALAWYDIAGQLNSDSETCRSKWLEIQHSYAFIKGKINYQWELESLLRAHPKTSMYLDGSLSFLDPYVQSINKIPKFILRRYRWIDSYVKASDKPFCESDDSSTFVTQEKVQAALAKRTNDNCEDIPNIKYIMEVVGTTITQCIMRLKNSKENCETIDIARKNQSLLQTVLEKDTDYCSNQSIVQEEINCENSEMGDHLDDLSVVDNDELENLAADSDDMKEEEPDCNDVTEIKPEDSVLETDLKTFFGDLVDFVSENFTLEKQKLLQRRVTDLVCELYTDNDSE